MPPNVSATTCKDSKSRLHCRPKLTYSEIITRSLMSMDNHTGTVAEVYTWIETNILFYKHYGVQHWKNSIRHNLSSKKIFVQIKAQGSANTWTRTPKTIADYKQKAMASTAAPGPPAIPSINGAAFTHPPQAPQA